LGTTSANVSVQVVDNIANADATKSLEQKPTTAQQTTANEFAADESKGSATEEVTIKKKNKAKEEKKSDKKSTQLEEVEVSEVKHVEEESKVLEAIYLTYTILYYVQNNLHQIRFFWQVQYFVYIIFLQTIFLVFIFVLANKCVSSLFLINSNFEKD